MADETIPSGAVDAFETLNHSARHFLSTKCGDTDPEQYPHIALALIMSMREQVHCPAHQLAVLATAMGLLVSTARATESSNGDQSPDPFWSGLAISLVGITMEKANRLHPAIKDHFARKAAH